MRGCVLERNIRDKVFFCTQLLHWQRFASSSQFYNQSIRKGCSSFFKGENWTDFACLLTAYLEVSHFLWVRCNFYLPWEWQALVFLAVCVLLFLTCLWTTRLFCFLFSACLLALKESHQLWATAISLSGTCLFQRLRRSHCKAMNMLQGRTEQDWLRTVTFLCLSLSCMLSPFT